jgi:Uri superfamily endonuclease
MTTPANHPLQEMLPPTPGTYALVLELAAANTLVIGRLGEFRLAAGTYVYVGSALGPGGLRARVGRHLRREKKPHWHIDALTAAALMVEVWAVESKNRLECHWAAALRALPGTRIPVAGFGASDCACTTHQLNVADPLAARNRAAATMTRQGLLYWPVPRDH